MVYDPHMAGRRPPGYFVPIDRVRPLVSVLEKRYGSLPQISQATGIPYRTLQGIMLVGKNNQVTPTIAARIQRAVEAPPEVVTESAWEKRYVNVARLRPMVLFLEKAYGGLEYAAKVIGVSVSVLRAIKNETSRGAKKDSAIKIIESVQSLRYGDRTWSIYENDSPPRQASPQEQKLTSIGRKRKR